MKNGDWKPNWGNEDEIKYSVGYNHQSACHLYVEEHWFCQGMSTIYFRNEKDAEESIKRFPEDYKILAGIDGV